jgi:hypothetical protein
VVELDPAANKELVAEPGSGLVSVLGLAVCREPVVFVESVLVPVLVPGPGPVAELVAGKEAAVYIEPLEPGSESMSCKEPYLNRRRTQ